jgi:hypothetical protein
MKPISVLFVLLTAGLTAIGVYAAVSGALVIGVAALVIAGWMGALALSTLRH